MSGASAHGTARGAGLRASAAILLVLLLLVPPLTTTSSSNTASAALAPSPTLKDLEAPVALHAPAALGGFSDPVPVAASTSVQATITLAPRDPTGLANYVQLPGAAPLSPSQVAAEWGPSPASVEMLQGYLAGQGLTVRAPPNGLVWEVSGGASSFESAFGTTLVAYHNASAQATLGAGALRLAYASVPRLPAALPVVAISSPDAVGGLEPLVREVPAPLSSLDGATQSSAPDGGALPGVTLAGCPNASLTPPKVQAAYNITPVLATGNSGQGERIGIVDAYDTQEKPWRIEHDLALFSSCYHLPVVNASIAWPVAGPSGLNNSTSSGWGLEIALDVEWAHATAPNASITLVLSPNNAYGLYYGVDWLVATHSVDVISLSWGEPETGVFNFGPCNYECNATTDGTLATLGPVFQMATAEGMNIFVASGDCGAAGGTLQNTAWYPASDPHAVGVGGSVLNLSASGGYGSETAWSGTSSFCLNGGGSGGGFSVLPRPSWQTGTGFSRYANTTRGVPDVGLVAADPLGIFYQGNGEYVEGTSDAAPQWAGMDALLKEGSPAGAAGSGFLDPVLYQVLRSSRYSTDFHQVPTGWNGFAAGPGWDPLTGVGTPNFSQLFQDLTGGTFRSVSPTSPGTFLLSAQPAAGVSPLPVTFQAGRLPGGAPSANYTFYYGDTGPPYQEANATTTSTGNTSTFLYPAQAADNQTVEVNGTYTAFASAVDPSDNVSMSVPVAINVGNAGPLEVSVNATAGPAGGLTQIRAVAAQGTGPYRFSYFFGDGTYENGWAGDGPLISHIYARNGSYLLTVVANDSSTPMRGGSSSLCVVVGPGGPSCPTVPRTIVDDVVPAAPHLLGGATTMVRVTATFNGLPIAGASVTLAPRLGSLSSSLGVTNAAGDLFVNYTAPVVNQSYAFGIFANVSAPGYARGLGEALLLVDPTTGPSITPWVRFGQDPAVGGSSEAIVIGGLRAYRGSPASNASLSVLLSGAAPSDSISGTLDASGLFATTWDVPRVTARTDVVLTVSLSLPGYTTASFRFLLSVVPLTAPTGAEAVLSIGPTSIVSMGTVAVSLRANDTNGSAALPIAAQDVSMTTQPYGVLSHLRNTTVQGVPGVVGLFSTPITPTPLGDILMFNISAGPLWAGASAAGLVEVHGGYGPIGLRFLPQPTAFYPGQKGNFTVQASSNVFGITLTRVFMLVNPDVGNPSQQHGNSVFGWTDAYGNLTFPYTAPNVNATVHINVQAVGFVYSFSQANFTLAVRPVVVCCPNNTSSPATWKWSANYTHEAVGAVLVASLASALVAVLALDFRRAPPRTPADGHAPAAPALPQRTELRDGVPPPAHD